MWRKERHEHGHTLHLVIPRESDNLICGRLACVASVSNRVIARKLERKRKKSFFCSLSTFLDELARKRLLRWLRSDDRSELMRITKTLSLWVVLIFVVIHSPCNHALRKKSTIKRSVDDLELFDGQYRKSARIIGFLSCNAIENKLTQDNRQTKNKTKQKHKQTLQSWLMVV